MVTMSGLLVVGVGIPLLGMVLLLTQVFYSARSRIVIVLGILLVVAGVIWVSGLLLFVYILSDPAPEGSRMSVVVVVESAGSANLRAVG